jgi:hypothetical protein
LDWSSLDVHHDRQAGDPLTDHWGRAFRLKLRRRPAGGVDFQLASAGADGTFDTADDVSRGGPLVRPATETGRAP